MAHSLAGDTGIVIADCLLGLPGEFLFGEGGVLGEELDVAFGRLPEEAKQ
jgi:hypothetical protein